MKYAIAALAAACALLVGGNVYQALPESTPTPKHSAAYYRVDKLLSSLQKGDYKAACEVLTWFSANKFITDGQCAMLMEEGFKGTKLIYQIVGDVRATPKYAIVTALLAQDDLTTPKVNESAVCAKKWAAGETCAYAGVYTFGVALYPSPKDAFSGKKHPAQHFYVFWID